MGAWQVAAATLRRARQYPRLGVGVRPGRLPAPCVGPSSGGLRQENAVEQTKALVKNSNLSKVIIYDLKQELFDLKHILDTWAAGGYQQVQASTDAIVSNQSAVFHTAVTLFPNMRPLGRLRADYRGLAV